LKVSVAEPSKVSKYTFGTKTAIFHICATCGVVPVVTSEIEGQLYAVVSVHALEGVNPSLLRLASATFEGEDEQARLARRVQNWIGFVEYVQAGT